MSSDNKTRERRNLSIKKQIKELVDGGYKLKESIPIVAEKFFLSSSTVRDIWFRK